MAQLGSIPLFVPGPSLGLSCGAAFMLTSAASADALLALPGAELEIKAGQRDIVVRFEGATSAEDAAHQSYQLAQKGLDMLSVLGQVDLAIQEAENENLVWWSDPRGIVLRLTSTSTMTMKLSVGTPKLEIPDKNEDIIQPSSPSPGHHIAFRYYRLAQTTEDLYDAYRNMYLAFESLLSSQFPKFRGERELDWLHRSLECARSAIVLDNLVVPSQDIVETLIQVVYLDARLPLFHAKDGQGFFPPQASPMDRQVVARALTVLTQVVLRMADAWHGIRRAGGGVFYSWVYENIKQLLNACSMVITECADPVDVSERDLSHERFRIGVKLESRLAPELERRNEPAFLGSIMVSDLAQAREVRRIEVITSDRPYIAQILESALVCDGALRLEVLMHFRATNLSQPKSLFRR